MRSCTVLLLCAAATFAGAQAAPEQCLAKPQSATATAEWQGKTYFFASAACREEFVKDPERWSQLYDALLELQEAGRPMQAPAPSLVPS